MLSLIPLRGWLIIGAVAAVLIGCLVVIRSIERNAADKAIETIERANNAAREKATTGENAVSDCYARNGYWDRANRMCNDKPRVAPVWSDQR